MKRPGFTLVETLLVVGTIGIIAAFSSMTYNNLSVRTDLKNMENQTRQAMAMAQQNARAGKNDSDWSVYIPTGTVGPGSAYPFPVSAESQLTHFPMASTVAVNGLIFVTYKKGTGLPTMEGDINLKSIHDETVTLRVTIAVDKMQVANNPSETVTICHYPSPYNPATRYTMTVVSEAVAQTHYQHGDTFGPCPGTASSAGGGSSAPGVSSSAGTASSASSAPSGAGWPSCTKFTVDADNQIMTTASTNVTFKHYASKITFGSGGPQIPVHVCHEKPNGSGWGPLFGGSGNCNGSGNAYGNAVPPSSIATETVSYASGRRVNVKIVGRYKIFGWLAFFESFTLYTKNDNVKIYANGDTIPDFPPYGGQQSLRAYLTSKGLTNASHQFVGGVCDALVVANLDGFSSDYQDEIMLISAQ